ALAGRSPVSNRADHDADCGADDERPPGSLEHELTQQEAQGCPEDHAHAGPLESHSTPFLIQDRESVWPWPEPKVTHWGRCTFAIVRRRQWTSPHSQERST